MATKGDHQRGGAKDDSDSDADVIIPEMEGAEIEEYDDLSLGMAVDDSRNGSPFTSKMTFSNMKDHKVNVLLTSKTIPLKEVSFAAGTSGVSATFTWQNGATENVQGISVSANDKQSLRLDGAWTKGGLAVYSTEEDKDGDVVKVHTYLENFTVVANRTYAGLHDGGPRSVQVVHY